MSLTNCICHWFGQYFYCIKKLSKSVTEIITLFMLSNYLKKAWLSSKCFLTVTLSSIWKYSFFLYRRSLLEMQFTVEMKSANFFGSLLWPWIQVMIQIKIQVKIQILSSKIQVASHFRGSVYAKQHGLF